MCSARHVLKAQELHQVCFVCSAKKFRLRTTHKVTTSLAQGLGGPWLGVTVHNSCVYLLAGLTWCNSRPHHTDLIRDPACSGCGYLGLSFRSHQKRYSSPETSDSACSPAKTSTQNPATRNLASADFFLSFSRDPSNSGCGRCSVATVPNYCLAQVAHRSTSKALASRGSEEGP